MKVDIFIRAGDKEAERATRRISRDQVSLIYDGKVVNNFIKEGHFNFGSSFLQGAPSQVIHINFGITVNHGAVSGCETGCSFVNFFEFVKLVRQVGIPDATAII